MYFHNRELSLDVLKTLPSVIENFQSYNLDQLSMPGWEVIFKNYIPKIISTFS